MTHLDRERHTPPRSIHAADWADYDRARLKTEARDREPISAIERRLSAETERRLAQARSTYGVYAVLRGERHKIAPESWRFATLGIAFLLMTGTAIMAFAGLIAWVQS